MNPEEFAKNEYRGFRVYQELAKQETNAAFRDTLHKLVATEKEHFDFWDKLSIKQTYRVSILKIWLYVFMRRILGLTFVARFLERGEKETIAAYRRYQAKITDPVMKNEIERMIEHETSHEQGLINEVKEERVQFISSIILGLNDGLIELTGSL